MELLNKKRSLLNIFILKFVFFMFILFLASIPWIYGHITIVDTHIILCVIGGVVGISFSNSLYWLRLFNLSQKVDGSKEVVYKKLDLVQFEKMSYLNMGYKTRGVFLDGYVVNHRISQVFSERYDFYLLIFSICGAVILFLGLGNPEFSAKSIHFNLLRFSAIRTLVSGLGGYMIIWSLSLYVMGLFCKFYDSGDKA